jgi:hypothetical protein
LPDELTVGDISHLLFLLIALLDQAADELAIAVLVVATLPVQVMYPH